MIKRKEKKIKKTKIEIKKKKKINAGMFAMLAVVVLLCGVLGNKMVSLYLENEELAAEEESLFSEIDDEEERTEELEEQEVYVQTDKYVEEVAYSLGYVYPGEIIFKASE